MPDTDRTLPARLPRRLAALTYDGVIVLGLVFFVTLVLVLARGGEAIPPGSWWYPTALFATGFAFFGFSWTRGGQTLGARAWGLRVETTEGNTLNWKTAAARYLAAFVLLAPPGLGLIWAYWDEERRCWHDRLSGTRVVWHPRQR